MISPRTPGAGRPDKPFPIVAVGASAGGLPPFERFLSALPAKFGFALVFMQHLSSKHKSLLPELLRSRAKDLKIEEASDGLVPVPGTLYLCPPGKEVRIRKGIFSVISRSREHLHLPIDEFLVSLSEDIPERTIAIILSGAGTDGARGVQAVRTQGGTVFVQDPSTAEYPDMPLAAISTGQMDGILSPEDIAKEILRFHNSGMVDTSADDFMTPADFDSLHRLVNERTGCRFNHYKRNVILRRVRRRMYLQGISSIGDYLRMIVRSDSEAALLAADLLIGVTAFFRDRLAWKALHLEVTRKFSVEESALPIRVWTAACATGEEAYSIAMMLQHELDAAGKKREIQVFATDVNDRALERAREGRYQASIAADLPPDYLRNYFTATEDGLSVTVSKEIRQRVVFARQDLLTDPPFSKLDLVICRNVLIYLEPDAQEKCIALFHYALKEGGYLFLGNAESPGRNSTLFTSLAHKKCRIYQRADSKQSARIPLSIPFAAERSSPKSRPAPEQRQSITHFIQEALLEAHAPAAVAINQHHEILYHNGPTNRYLHQPRGAPTQNLLELLPDKLRNKMRSALYRAADEGKPVAIRTNVKVDERKKQLSILVSRLQENLFLITFGEKGASSAELEVSPDPAAIEETVVRQLENELVATRDDLQSHIEQLKSLNEELESSNEELQAANEELETSREELQSLNEELTTVNSQLQTKIEEQEETNNNLNNFLTSTSIPTVFLDPQLRVRLFTPAMARLITLIPGDIGRPIVDMARENLGPDLIADAQSVLDDLTPVKKELPINGTWYVRSVLPYRTSDNRIEGVVVTYGDVTELKRVEDSLRRSEGRYRELVQNANSAIIRWKAGGTITFLNEYAQTFFGYTPAEAIGRSVAILVPEKESTGADPTSLVQNIVADPERYVNNINENVCRDGRRVWMAWTNKPICDDHGQVVEILAVGMDITERKRAEDRIGHLASFPELNPNPVLEVSTSGEVTYSNPAARHLLTAAGMDEEDVTALLPEDMKIILDTWDGQDESTFYREVAVGDRVVEDAIHFVPRFKVARVYGRDITERKHAEEALRESEERFRALFTDMSEGVCLHRLIYDEKGTPINYEILDANPQYETILGIDRTAVVHRLSTEAYKASEPPYLAEYSKVVGSGRPHHFETHYPPMDKYFYISVSSMGKDMFATIFFDITERKHQEHRIERLTRLYAMLSQVNETIVRTGDEVSLFSEVCRIMAERGGFPLVWIGTTDDRRVIPKAFCGEEADYLKEIRVEVEGEFGVGPTGTCIRENRPVINDDFATNPAASPWREQALRRGFHASAAFPLRRQGKAIGSFTLYAFEPGAFDADQIGLLEALSADISYALDAMETDTKRKQADDALQSSLSRFRLLAETAGDLLRAPDPQAEVTSVALKVMEYLGCDAFFNFLADDEAGRLRLNACAGIPDEERRKIEWLDYGIAICGCAARDACRIVAEHIPTTPDVRTELVKSYGIRAYACHPLLGPDEKVIGTLSFGTRNRETFGAEDLSFMKAVTDQLATAMIRMKIESELKRSREGLERRVEERTEELQKAYDQLVEQTKEREALERQLRQAQKMEALGTLTGGIAHDFNNILAAMIGFTEILSGRAGKESRDKRHLDRILEAGLRGRELIKRMMAFSRKTEQEKKPLLLGSIVRETVKFVRSSTPATVSIRTRVNGESGMVFADPIQMQQVVLNLCTNAAQIMQEKGGTLDVEVSEIVFTESNLGPEGMKPGPYVKLVVRDTGAGISPDVMDKIFDPFFTTKKAGEGTGLGLSVVHGIVYQHDGFITVESQEGKGSTFTVFLPVVAKGLTRDGAVEQAMPMGTERVLFVDDEELLAEMGQEILQDLGYQVTVRTSSREALELFKSDPRRFDLIITDVTMPEITGVELARELLGMRHDIPIIMCTGFSHLIDAEAAKAAGIRAFVMKPLTKKEIAKTIRNVFDG